MKKSRLLIALLAGLTAFPAFGQLVKNKDWDKSPEFTYLATDDERKAWKNVKTDQEADAFIALFWARRDPELKTPANEFRMTFDARVAEADKLFAMSGGKRGALTERGKLFILVGPPKTLSRSAGTKSGVSIGSGTGDDGRAKVDVPDAGTNIGESLQRFTYEADQMPKWSSLHALVAEFAVEQTTDSLVAPQTRGLRSGTVAEVRGLEKQAAEVALVHPELKEPPHFMTKEEAVAKQKAANEAAMEAAKGVTLTPAVRTALEGLLGQPASGPLSAIGIAYRDGAIRLMVQLYVEAGQVPAPEAAKLAILVKAKEGADAGRREEAAALQKTKGDYFADRSFEVAPGDYEVAAALMDAEGKTLVSGHRSVKVEALPKTFASSPLILAANDLPAEGAKPEEPFVFSSRKFVAKGDGKFSALDGLGYAVRIYNPAMDPATKKINLKRAMKIKPKSGAPIEVPMPPEEPMDATTMSDGKNALVVDLAGSVVDSGLGQYFKAGDYTVTMTITDTGSGQHVDFSVPFSVAAAPKSGPAPKK